MLDQLIQLQPELEERGVALAAVTMGKPSEAKLFCERQAPGVACLADPQRLAYRAYGLRRGSNAQIVGPAVYRATLRAVLLYGHSVEMPPEGQDGRQMPGVFLINTEGRVRWAHYHRAIGDNPSPKTILRALARVTR